MLSLSDYTTQSHTNMNTRDRILYSVGMAEMPFIPYASAVIAAAHDATGVWIDDFPLTPDRVRAGLKEAGI